MPKFRVYYKKRGTFGREDEPLGSEEIEANTLLGAYKEGEKRAKQARGLMTPIEVEKVEPC